MSSILASVPIPLGVTYVLQRHAVQRGEGLFTTPWNEVDRSYKTKLSCGELESRWIRALRDAHWHFQLEVQPHHLYVSSGAIRIWVTGRGADVSIYVGDIAPAPWGSGCQTPDVSASGSPGLSL